MHRHSADHPELVKCKGKWHAILPHLSFQSGHVNTQRSRHFAQHHRAWMIAAILCYAMNMVHPVVGMLDHAVTTVNVRLAAENLSRGSSQLRET